MIDDAGISYRLLLKENCQTSTHFQLIILYISRSVGDNVFIKLTTSRRRGRKERRERLIGLCFW